MNQLERVRYMEQILDEASEAMHSLEAALERVQALQPRIAELEAYYTSPLWRQDYEDDCAGRLPKGLKRGVLSEDAVYDLLQMQKEWRHPGGEKADEDLSF